MTKKNVNKNLSKILDVEEVKHEKPKPVTTNTNLVSIVETSNNAIVGTSQEAPVANIAELQDDFVYARDRLKVILETGNTALNKLVDVAHESEEPRAYEVIAKLITSMTDATDKLMDVHVKNKIVRNPIKGKFIKGAPIEFDDNSGEGTNQINVDKAIFVGSTTDLIAHLRDFREQQGEIPNRFIKDVEVIEIKENANTTTTN